MDENATSRELRVFLKNAGLKIADNPEHADLVT
jgi:hypothetical protein